MTEHNTTKVEQDDLSNDLTNIIDKADVTYEQKQTLMTELTIYIVDRDARLRRHAYAQGRASV